jgi:uncharacterized protein (DUF983 family)
MEQIHFKCPNGHKVKAPLEAGGKLGRCPQCASVTLVPEPIAQLIKRRVSMTESAVLRVLGDAPPLPPIPDRLQHVAPRNCPRCNRSLKATATVCEHCQLYVGLHSPTDTRAKLGESNF